MDNEKRFTCVDTQHTGDFADLNTAAACLAGWWDVNAGRTKLEELEVGDQCIDDDGDTWERIA
jgi:hypothetical protein